MQRRHKFLWMKGTAEWDYTQDGRFKKPKIQKNEKIICRKMKRRYFKNQANKEIEDFLERNEDKLMKECYNIEDSKICTYCGQPIYIHRESHINDLGSTIFHANCYGQYIALVYGRYQEVI